MAEYLTDAELAQAKDMLNRITMIYQAKVVGQEDLRTALTACLLAGGHVLVESVPGLAKTTAAHDFGLGGVGNVPPDPVHSGPHAQRHRWISNLEPGLG